MCGESTGLVVAISEGMVFGASVGDSVAVLADAGVTADLMANRRRKPPYEMLVGLHVTDDQLYQDYRER